MREGMNKKLLRQTVIGVDFLSAITLKQKQPSVDSFLDYRGALMKAKDNRPTMDKSWLDREINAVDEILNYLTNPDT